jgi:hypothetical protein
VILLVKLATLFPPNAHHALQDSISILIFVLISVQAVVKHVALTLQIAHLALMVSFWMLTVVKLVHMTV